MNRPFKPMLADDADLTRLRFPLLASAKLDGIRAIVINGVVMSRSLKPIPNKHVQNLFKGYEYLDGELIVGEPHSKTVYRDTMSGVMSVEGEPSVTFFAFDHIENPHWPYKLRAPQKPRKNVIILNQCPIHSLEELLTLEASLIERGYEGLILRDPEAQYKYGRSTVKEGILLKLKRFTDAEFEVIGFEERMHNGNEATTNELGRTKRSSHKAGKVGLGDLGALVLQGDGFTFNCGTGFDDVTRNTIWRNRDKYLGQLAKVKYFAVGMKDAPRHPVFLGWRDKIDT